MQNFRVLSDYENLYKFLLHCQNRSPPSQSKTVLPFSFKIISRNPPPNSLFLHVPSSPHFLCACLPHLPVLHRSSSTNHSLSTHISLYLQKLARYIVITHFFRPSPCQHMSHGHSTGKVAVSLFPCLELGGVGAITSKKSERSEFKDVPFET